MNDIINKFSLFGDKFMPEMDLRQPGFTYSACIIQNYDSIICGSFCIGFIDYMFKGISLTDYTNLHPTTLKIMMI